MKYSASKVTLLDMLRDVKFHFNTKLHLKCILLGYYIEIYATAFLSSTNKHLNTLFYAIT